MNKFKSINFSPKKIITSAILFYIIIFSLLSVWKLENFAYNSLDLAIINQVFYNSAHGNFFQSSIHPPSYLGDHVTPILFLLLPFYFLYQSPLTLLILQTIILAFSAWPLYLITKKIINQKWGVILAVLWLINPFVQNINLFEFHFLPFAIFFILFAFYFFIQKNFWLFLLFSLLSILVREDVALVIAGFGLISLIEKRQLKWIVTPIIASVIYFFAALKIASLFNPDDQYKFLLYYSYLGQTPQEFLINILTKPWLILIKLFSLNNIIFSLGLLLPFVLIPIFAPTYLILGLGPFLQLSLTQTGGSEVFLLTHYTSLLLPGLFIALIYSLKKIVNGPFVKRYPGLFSLIFFSGSFYAFATLGPLPNTLKELVPLKNKSLYEEFVEKIPVDASVATTYKTLTTLSSRQKIYSFSYIFLGKQQFLGKDYPLPKETDYLLVDFQDFLSYELQYGKNLFYQNYYNERLNKWSEVLNDYGLIEINQNLALFKINQPSSLSLIEELNEQKVKDDQKIYVNEEVEFLGYNENEEFLETFWNIKKITKNYFVKINGYYLPLGYSFLNQSSWENKKVKINYYFKDVEEFKLVTIAAGGLELDGKRSSVDVIDDKKILQKFIVN